MIVETSVPESLQLQGALPDQWFVFSVGLILLPVENVSNQASHRFNTIQVYLHSDNKCHLKALHKKKIFLIQLYYFPIDASYQTVH